MNTYVEKRYEVNMEIAGPLAFFSSPSSGAGHSSYFFPTFSAAKGMFESICTVKNGTVIPYKVEICKPIRTSEIAFNYHGHLRKGDLITKQSPAQITITVLQDVCYKLYAVIRNSNVAKNEIPERYRELNGAHSFQEQLMRRIRRGQCNHIPCLGTSEFLPTYWGEIRDTTRAIMDINLVIPLMLKTPFDKLWNGNFKPQFMTNVEVKNGTVIYPIEEYLQ